MEKLGKIVMKIGLVLMAVLALPSLSQAATGDFVGAVNFGAQCASGVGVGITYDGTNLWYSCYSSSPDLYRADPVTGNVIASYSINGGLGALAYDAGRNVIWAGWGGPGIGNIIKIQLDGAKTVTGSTFAFTALNPNGYGIDDGIAYDATDDTLYVSPDVSPTIYHYTVGGTLVGSFPTAPGSSCGNSGLALGGSLLYEGFDGCSQVIVVDKASPSTVVFTFSTVVAGDPNFRDEGLTCDPNTFAPVDVMWSKEAYAPMRAHAYEIPKGSCGFGGLPPSGGSISGMKFNDINGDGIKDVGEPGLPRWTITLTNSSGTVSTVTDANGNYVFAGLDAGTYTVGEVTQAGYTQTAPKPVPPGTYTVTLAANQQVTGKDFGNHKEGGVQLEASCVATVNPAGKQIPTAGTNPKSGQNPDGFYMIGASNPLASIFVVDTGSLMEFGPFASGTNIKYTEANGAKPNQKAIGGPNSAVTVHITGKGDAAVYAMLGNVKSPRVYCLVPPPPK